MEWKLSQDTESKNRQEQGAEINSSREQEIPDWGHSERNVPTPVLDRVQDPLSGNVNRETPVALEDSEDERLRAYDLDIKAALNSHQTFASPKSLSKGQVYVKLWDKRLERINLSYFGEDTSAIDAHFQTVLKQYFRRYPTAINQNVWFSQETQSMLSNAQTYCSGLDPIAHSFCTTKTNFINQ